MVSLGSPVRRICTLSWGKYTCRVFPVVWQRTWCRVIPRGPSRLLLCVGLGDRAAQDWSHRNQGAWDGQSPGGQHLRSGWAEGGCLVLSSVGLSATMAAGWQVRSVCRDPCRPMERTW